MTPDEKEIFKARLYSSCLSRYKRKKDAVKVERCPDGFCLGSVDTFVEKQTVGWQGYGGFGNLGKRFPAGCKRKKR